MHNVQYIDLYNSINKVIQGVIERISSVKRVCICNWEEEFEITKTSRMPRFGIDLS